MKRDRIPMRWPESWKDPARLKLLENTPVNCLVGEKPPPFPLGEIEFLRLDAQVPPDGVATREGAWPAVQRSQNRGDATDAGPTGAPWVDSNAGVIRLAQAMDPGRKIWLTYPAPPKTEVIRPREFARPVAEAEAYGAHWVIDLHDSLRTGLENEDAEALDAWRTMMRALEFAGEHAEWQSWTPAAALTVVSDFEGDNEFLGAEFLNLAPRGHLAYRIVTKDAAAEASFAGQKAVLYIDTAPPEGPLRDRLFGFAEGGGLLILPLRPDGLTGESAPKQGYNIYRHGRGRIAVPREEWYDPYLLAADVHLLLSHREDVVRIWNGGTMNSHYVEAADGKSGVVHIVGYSSRASHGDVTLGFARKYRSARVFTLDGVKEVRPVPSRLGVEVPLPRFSVYAAVELES